MSTRCVVRVIHFESLPNYGLTVNFFLENSVDFERKFKVSQKKIASIHSSDIR